ncbi:MAG: DUF1307 domain-containing protein [Firmicutes bacterium]|nr:DUF1307 domain-containing protein [Bacillota bacterium]
MKKVKKILGIVSCLLFVIFLVSGCGTEEEKTLSCALYRKDVVSNYELNSTYEIYYTGDVVNRVETVEVVSSSDESIIDLFETTLNSTYESMNDAYGGYDFTVTKEAGKVTATTKIDYTKLDLEQLIKDDSSMKSIVNNDNQITVDGIKKLYEQTGAECK